MNATQPFTTRDADTTERLLLDAGLRLTVAAVGIQTASHVLNRVAFDLEHSFLDAGADLSFFAFWSATATSVCAAATLVLAAASPERARLLLALGCGLGYLAVDDMFALHERVAVRLDTALPGVEDAGRLLWPIVLMPILAGCFVALWTVSSTLTERARRFARCGLGLLAVAIGLEMLSFVLVNAGQRAPGGVYEMEMLVEEGAELGAWLLISIALATAVLRAGSASD